jgi:hypothetical protein
MLAPPLPVTWLIPICPFGVTSGGHRGNQVPAQDEGGYLRAVDTC